MVALRLITEVRRLRAALKAQVEVVERWHFDADGEVDFHDVVPSPSLTPVEVVDREELAIRYPEPSVTPLYTPPDWLTKAVAWLETFRAAVEAAGLECVPPELDYPSDCGDEGFVWRSDHGCLDVEMGHLMRFHGDPQQRVESTDLPACVELYRRWLGGPQGAAEP